MPPKEPKDKRDRAVAKVRPPGGELRRVLDRASGARLCYGEPVVAGDRTVIPVSRVRAAGGWGYGRGSEADGDEGAGHGGGGWIDAQPVGFVELGPDGARYERIPDPDQLGRTLKAAATALVTVSGALALGRRRGRGRLRARSPRGLLGRGD